MRKGLIAIGTASAVVAVAAVVVARSPDREDPANEAAVSERAVEGASSEAPPHPLDLGVGAKGDYRLASQAELAANIAPRIRHLAGDVGLGLSQEEQLAQVLSRHLELLLGKESGFADFTAFWQAFDAVPDVPHLESRTEFHAGILRGGRVDLARMTMRTPLSGATPSLPPKSAKIGAAIRGDYPAPKPGADLVEVGIPVSLDPQLDHHGMGKFSPFRGSLWITYWHDARAGRWIPCEIVIFVPPGEAPGALSPVVF